MGVKFEIEAKWKTGKGEHEKNIVFARCLEMEESFEVTDHSSLGGIEISKYLDQPRKIDKDGKPKLDVFAFLIKYKKDVDKLKEGQIVELTYD